jgi:hypothetical protein
MKAFTIYSFKSGFYRIKFCYRNYPTDKITHRFSDYPTKETAQKAAQGFLKRGYKIVDDVEKIK